VRLVKGRSRRRSRRRSRGPLPAYREVVEPKADRGREPWDDSLDTVAVLGDGVRRRVYAFARAATTPVTREDTAQSVGITRKLAAFHLDRLVDAGLLTSRPADRAEHRRVGRTPKVYQPSDVEIRVGIPARHHDLLAEILVDALAPGASMDSVTEAAVRVASERGRADGRCVHRAGQPTSTEDDVGRAVHVLRDCGYEPVRIDENVVRLRNCVFAPIAARSQELVCTLHHAYVSGLLTGVGATDATAVLAPTPGVCCVEVQRRPPWRMGS